MRNPARHLLARILLVFVINDSRWKPEHLFRLTILPVIPGPFKAPIFE